MDAARHQVVARPFRRRLVQDRRLDLEEVLLVEVAADLERRLVPQDHVLLQPLAAQIQIAVAQPHLFRDRRVLVDRERRRLRVVQQPDLAGGDLDLAGLDLRIDRFFRAEIDAAGNPDDKLRAQALGHFIRLVADDGLRDAVAVADVEEHDAAEIADAVDPSHDDDVFAGIGGGQFAAGVGTSESSEGLYAHSMSDVRCPMPDVLRMASATVPRATACCSPVFMFLILTCRAPISSRPDDGDEPGLTRVRVLERLSEVLAALERLGIHLDAQTGRSQFSRQLSATRLSGPRRRS